MIKTNNSSLDNKDLIELNELNAKSNGGTEITTRGIFSRLPRELLEDFQIITSRVRDVNDDKIKILHLHDLAQDPEAAHLKDENSRARFERLVFVSDWQFQQYQNYLGVPLDLKSIVIPNGIEPIPEFKKPNDKVRLIYTSTPHRGLEILVPVFEALCKQIDNIELDVYSSFDIYGWPERDKPYEDLFERCRNHPNINYHGTVPHEDLTEAYQKAHIFAYPSIWPETFCRCLAEAMSARCICVHPNLAALPETSGGLTQMYCGTIDGNDHANFFAHNLKYAIKTIQDQHDQERLLDYIKMYADLRYSWDGVTKKWESILRGTKAEWEYKQKNAKMFTI